MRIIRNICLWLMLAVALGMPVLAAGAGMTLQASKETVQPGDTFTVKAILENDKAIGLGTVALEYDEKVFELVGGTCLLENAMFGEVLLKEKVGTFLLMLPRKISGPVFSFDFRVKSNAAPGNYEIGAEASVGDSKGSNVAVTGAEVRVGNIHIPTDSPKEEVTEPKPPVQPVIPTTGEIADPDETGRPEETTPTTEQTQPSLPTQSQGHPEVTTPAAPTDGTAPAENADGRWWMLIPLILGCGVAVIAIRKKNKA